MTLALDRLLGLDERTLSRMSDAEMAEAARGILQFQEQDRQENQLLFYRPASPRAAEIHKSMARIVGAGGGNGSSKTETVLVEIMALATGVLPHSIRAQLLPKFRGPVNCRIVLESLTTVLEPVFLPKLQWWKWTGVGEAGSDKGHWGWIPKFCLKGGSWEKAWRDKIRVLTVLCRDPNNLDRILGESTIQFNSHDQDPSDFASGDFHHVMHDEPPRLAIWRENEARTMRVKGRLYLAMTWPDDPTIPVDWIFDEIYEKGVPGPTKAKDVDWFELWTTDNTHLDQDSVRAQMGAWSETTKQVRIFGQPIRFSNRIHPLFTDKPQWWSYPAGKIVLPENGKCPETGSSDIIEFCHVQDVQPSNRWPTIFCLDPHPRKPHMFLWAQIDPNDDLTIIEEGALDADPADLRDYIFRFEEAHGLRIADRLIDPNMGRSPASAIRGITWQDEFSNVGLNCALADDSDVGRGRINEYLRPDPRTMKPRLVWASRCQTSIFQMKRYVWDNYRRQDERDLKQTPKPKNDDYPTLAKYLLNSNPSFRVLNGGAPVVRSNRSMEARTAVRVR
jgi:hypothetical protein